MICGIRGDRGVCPLLQDHTGPCETNTGMPIHYTPEESAWNRYTRILGDFTFLISYTMHQLEDQKANDY
jgi:hypothetical protein